MNQMQQSKKGFLDSHFTWRRQNIQRKTESLIFLFYFFINFGPFFYLLGGRQEM